MNKKRMLLLFVVLAVLLSACATSPTFLNPASPIANKEASLYRTVLVMALIVFVPMEGALIWIVIRDRKREGDDGHPKQVHGNNSLEVIWTSIPVLVVIALFVLSVQTVNAVAIPPATDRDINLQVVGHQWWWEFDYPDLKIVTANELHIPVGTNVHISLESADVIHSFWVPQLTGKTDAVPGQHNTMWIRGDTVGEYYGQCAEFCGTEHALMRIKVVVQTQDDFDAWVANQQEPAYSPQSELEQKGFDTITNGACNACHTLDPSRQNGTELKGPNLAHLFSRSVFAGATFDLNESNIHEWLMDTQAMKPGNDMDIKITKDEMDGLMAYLIHLK
ncbi:MAG TPA: cytochrome c oxidase subunit II [Anaerolineales bacterium]|nr:cytochrome c oxidase subunit II [Anaerolineales bacterium]